MLFEGLRTSLKEKIAPLYVMTGSDIFLISKSVELILAAASVNPMNVTHLNEEATASEINAILRNVSMFGGRVAVVVRGELQTRVYLEPVANEKTAVTVDCNPMNETLVVRMILQNKRFTPDAAIVLARACENNFSAVSNEMEKICAYFEGEKIDAADVGQIVTKTEKYQVYEFSNALIKKDSAKAEKILDTLLLSGIDEYAVFGSLLAFTRRLFYARACTLPDAAVAGFLGVHPYSITALRRDGRGITKERAADIYAEALDLEYQIKSGKIAAGRAAVLLAGSIT